MPDILTYRGTVYPWQRDHIGHMNVMWYVGKFDEPPGICSLRSA
jgi:acyl-CoA thioester hydrolase